MKLLACIASLLLTSAAFAVTVQGTVTLQNASTYEGTEISFEPLTPSATPATAFSTEDGAYEADVTPGLYNVVFSHSGYYADTLSEIAVISEMTLPDVTLNTLEGLSGEISGELERILKTRKARQ